MDTINNNIRANPNQRSQVLLTQRVPIEQLIETLNEWLSQYENNNEDLIVRISEPIDSMLLQASDSNLNQSGLESLVESLNVVPSINSVEEEENPSNVTKERNDNNNNNEIASIKQNNNLAICNNELKQNPVKCNKIDKSLIEKTVSGWELPNQIEQVKHVNNIAKEKLSNQIVKRVNFDQTSKKIQESANIVINQSTFRNTVECSSSEKQDKTATSLAKTVPDLKLPSQIEKRVNVEPTSKQIIAGIQSTSQNSAECSNFSKQQTTIATSLVKSMNDFDLSNQKKNTNVDIYGRNIVSSQSNATSSLSAIDLMNQIPNDCKDSVVKSQPIKASLANSSFYYNNNNNNTVKKYNESQSRLLTTKTCLSNQSNKQDKSIFGLNERNKSSVELYQKSVISSLKLTPNLKLPNQSVKEATNQNTNQLSWNDLSQKKAAAELKASSSSQLHSKQLENVHHQIKTVKLPPVKKKEELKEPVYCSYCMRTFCTDSQLLTHKIEEHNEPKPETNAIITTTSSNSITSSQANTQTSFSYTQLHKTDTNFQSNQGIYREYHKFHSTTNIYDKYKSKASK